MIEIPLVVFVLGVALVSFLLGIAAGRAVKQDKLMIAIVTPDQCSELIEAEMESE